MTQTLFSKDWYRVKALCPQLQANCVMHRHRYRGNIWFVLENKSTNQQHRFNQSAYRLIALFDGKRNVDDVWAQVSDALEDEAPTQAEVIHLLAQLYQADILKFPGSGQAADFFQRQNQQQSQQLKQKLNNPLSQKLALWDPDQFLNSHLSKVLWLFQWPVAFIWFLVVSFAAVLAVKHQQDLLLHIKLQALSPYNLLFLFLAYPPIKWLHEMGHAFATKKAGGEVHEMGVNFLLLVPVPYVNVSSANAIPDKYQRMLVGAIGIMLELFVAAISLLIWLVLEPGLLRDFALSLVLLGGLSSLLFNGNPLLRYDGYYVLADILAIPNLGTRANQYVAYLAQRYVLGVREAKSPVQACGEAFWLFTYSISSCCYRLWVLWLIVIFVTEKYFIVGILLAVWLVTAQCLVPLVKIAQYTFSLFSGEQKSWRSLFSGLAFISLLIGLIFTWPFPVYTYAQGIVWLPENARIRAESAGFITQLQAEEPHQLAAGDAVALLTDPFIDAYTQILQAKLTELEANYRAEKLSNLVKAQMLAAELPALQSELAQAEKKRAGLLVKSGQAGQLVMPNRDDLMGAYVNQGDELGFVLDEHKPIIRTAVRQADMGKLRQASLAVQVRLAALPSLSLPARIVRETPEASDKLFSEALSTEGGGPFLLDPNQPQQMITLEKLFQVDIELDHVAALQFLGGRAYVRFEHPPEPLAKQWSRGLRQLFLSQFHV